jgi:hypothetical protein
MFFLTETMSPKNVDFLFSVAQKGGFWDWINCIGAFGKYIAWQSFFDVYAKFGIIGILVQLSIYLMIFGSIMEQHDADTEKDPVLKQMKQAKIDASISWYADNHQRQLQVKEQQEMNRKLSTLTQQNAELLRKLSK